MIALHHVQVACPPGGEDAARRFYGDGIGLTEVEKPEDLRGRGGAWFRAYDVRGGGQRGAPRRRRGPGRGLPARPTRRSSWTTSTRVAGSVTAAGGDVDWSERDTFAGYRRFHVRDPHGNRVEVLQPLDN